MQHDLAQRVQSVQAAASRLTGAYGLCRFAAAAVLTLLAFGFVDWLLRAHDPVLRWLFSAAAGILIVLEFARLAWPAICFRQELIATARRIEQQFPGLGERLSSAIAFLAEPEISPTAGSAALRRAVIAQAQSVASDIDFRTALDRRPIVRAGALLAAIAAVAGFFFMISPATFTLAASRLAMPWRNLPWPRQHELAFVNPPARLAKGDDLELSLLDRRGQLPDDAEILIRRETPAGWRSETRPVKPLGDRVVLRLDNVTEPLEYRARGGDDNAMPWQRLAVVEPPKLVDLQITVEPPAYASLPKKSEGQLVKALVGSRLTLRGELDKPIRSVRLKPESRDFPPPPIAVSTDGKRFSTSAGGSGWLVEKSGAFTIELIDQEGTPFGRDTRVEVQAIDDAPPLLAWEKPDDHEMVTPRAVVAVKGAATDDLAIRGIQLRYLRPGASDEEQIVGIYTAAASPIADQQVDQRPFDFAWDLSQLPGLTPGDVLAVRITADDFKSQFATTSVRRLTIISPEELEGRLATRQATILGQLADALRLAQQSHEQIESLKGATEAGLQLSPADLNRLQAAQYNHQQVQQLLSANREGAEGQLAALLEELAANRSENEASRERLSDLRTQVHDLNQGPIPIVDQELAEAAKTSGAGSKELGPRFDKAAQQEQAIIEALERMTGLLSQWDNISRIAREIGVLRTDQERLAGDTDDLIAKSAAAAGALPASDRSTARQLSQSQLALGRRLDRLQARMEGVLQKLTISDPPTAALLADAIDAARRLAIGGQMREVGMQLSQFQLTQARQNETKVIGDLNLLLKSLSTRSDTDLARRLSSLRDAASELAALSKRGAATESDLAAAAKKLSPNERATLERLRLQLEELAKAGHDLSRRLQRLQAERAASLVEQSAASSAAAARASSAGQSKTAQQQAHDARRQLEEAEKAVARAIAELEERLVHEQTASAEQAIAGIVARQKNVVREIERLDGQRDSAGQLPANNQSALKNLTAEQQLLADETDALRPRLAAAAFRFALETAAAQMRRAGESLHRGKTAAATQNAAQAALTRLEHLLEALKSEKQASQQPSASADGQPQQSAGNPPLNIVELKLLKFLQEEVNRRTKEIESRSSGGTALSDDDQLDLESLAGEQGRLADMILGLIETKTPRPQDATSTGSEGATGSGVLGGDNRSLGNDSLRQRLPTPSVFAAQNAPPAGKSSSANRSLDQQLLDGLDRELLKGLPAGPKAAPPTNTPPKTTQPKPDDAPPALPDSQNPLVQIAEQMRSAQRRIARRDTSTGTQDQQSDIVTRMQSLLDQASSSGGKQSGGGSAQQGIGTGEAVAGPPRDSANRIERGSPEQVETTDVKDLVRRMWGHLPPKLRDEMQASLSEEFLPKYQRLIEEYYKRLAEQRPGGP